MAQYLDYAGLKKYHQLIKKYIDDNIGEITSFEYVIPDNNTLPATGEKGKIYLISSAIQGDDSKQKYDEYIWIVDTASPTGRYEFIGTTAISLDGYLTEENAANTYVTKTNAENTYAKKSEIPTDTNTTYTFANGTNGFTVTPSGGSAQTVTVTPEISVHVGTAVTPGSAVAETRSIVFDSSDFTGTSQSYGGVFISSNISAIPLSDITLTELEKTTT